jgi:hypothetical protein
MKKNLPALSYGAFAFLLVSCGGGGGDDSTPVDFPIDVAASAIYTAAHTLSATFEFEGSPPHTDTLTLTVTPGGDSTFEGLAAKTAAISATLEENGTPPSTATISATEYFQISPYRYLGTVYGTGTYEVAANQQTLPTTARIGDSGNFYTSTSYTNSTKAVVEGNTNVNWSLERDATSNSRAYFCANAAETYTNGDDPFSTSTCYRIDATGSIIGLRVTFRYADGSSETFD